tara:strand:+ start:1238 stop:1510 length:273 start_codon:yes stop_codon:yes gene_type:complete
MTSPRNTEIVRYAKANAYDMTNGEIGERYGVTAERIRAILKRNGYKKPKKASLYACQKPGCQRLFRGVGKYSGEKAVFCSKHRLRRKQND